MRMAEKLLPRNGFSLRRWIEQVYDVS